MIYIASGGGAIACDLRDGGEVIVIFLFCDVGRGEDFAKTT